MAKSIQYFKLLQHESGKLLCKYISDEWNDMTKAEQEDFVTLNAWEPLEEEPARNIIMTIHANADSLQQFLEKFDITIEAE